MNNLSQTRRAFLSGLSQLPLIGGGVAIIGAPTASAEPVTDDLMHSYKNWLFFEHRMLSHELARYDEPLAREIERSFLCRNGGARWHFRHQAREGSRLADWESQPQPSSRAAVVLSAVGCEWRREMPGPA